MEQEAGTSNRGERTDTASGAWETSPGRDLEVSQVCADDASVCLYPSRDLLPESVLLSFTIHITSIPKKGTWGISPYL